MKNVMVALFLISFGFRINAQCPGCVPVDCSAQNPGGGICDTVIIGMANHQVDEKISFYMPTKLWRPEVPPSGGLVDLNRIKVTGVIGLPLGLNWETNTSPGNEYFPSAGDTIGCVRVCGTPLQAGTFPLTVYLLADITAYALGQTIHRTNEPQTYNTAVVIILPDTAGGVSSFSITPNISTSCSPLTLSFEAKIDGAPNPTVYNWNFGGGNTATTKTPANQTFSNPGTYPVTLTTTIMNYRITQFQVSSACGYDNDIEEVTTLQKPDMYFKLPLLGYISSEKSEQYPPISWTGLNLAVPAGTDSLEIQVWDKDTNTPIFGSSDDLLATAKIKLGVGTFFWSDIGGLCTQGGITISDTVGNVFSETLDIVIGELPNVSLVSSAADSICSGDTVVLTVMGAETNSLVWFKDSVLIPSFSDSLITVTQTARYRVEVTSPQGCKTSIPDKTVQVINTPPVPSLNFNTGSALLYCTNSSGVAHIQWFKDGVPIPGANLYSINIAEPGIYTVKYTNVLGCGEISADYPVMLSSIDGILSRNNFILFPNPNDGVFTIALTQENFSGSEIYITDNLGRQVYYKFVSAGMGMNTLEIDLSSFPSGIYFCALKTGNNHSIKKITIFNKR